MAFDFPSSPTVGQVFSSGSARYTWSGVGWVSENAVGEVRYDIPQSLTTTQQDQARNNIYAAPYDALAYNGMQINGGFDVSQERGYSNPITEFGYICDGWVNSTVGTMVLSSGSYPSTSTPGFSHLLRIDVATAQPSLAASDLGCVLQFIEGYRVARLGWGTSSASPITIGFWHSHTLVGTYTGTITNGATNRSYAFSYTQDASSVEEYTTITVPGDTSGTWLTTTGIGLALCFAFACGTTYTAPSLNAWFAGGYYAGPGQVNAAASTSNIMRLFGVVVLPGTQAPPAAQSPFIMRPYDQELQTCRRYFYMHADGSVVSNHSVGIGSYLTGAQFNVHIPFPVQMRATPTLGFAAPINGYAISRTGGIEYHQGWAMSASSPFGALIYTLGMIGTAGYSGWSLLNNAASKIWFDARL